MPSRIRQSAPTAANQTGKPVNGSVPWPTVVSAPRTPPAGALLRCCVEASGWPAAGAEVGPGDVPVTEGPLPPVPPDVCLAVLFAGFTPGCDGEFWLPPACESLLWPGAFSEFPGDDVASG